MFIFKIFKIRNQIKDIKEGVHDPAGFANKQVVGVVRGYIIVLAIATIVVLGLLFIFGYTSLIAGPAIFAKVLFWLLLIPIAFFWILISLMLWQAKRMIKRARSKFSRETIYVKAEVKDPEILEAKQVNKE